MSAALDSLAREPVATPSGGYSIVRLREILASFYDRSTALALALITADIGLFAAGEWLVARGGSLWLELAGGALATVAIVRLFVIGHDACHASLTDHATLNKVLGRIAFLPSLTPFSLWRVGHNVVHHGFNNLKGRDFVWEPLDPAEWQALSPRRQLLERVYRSAFGPLPYYLVEIWWRRLYFPGKANAPGQRAEFFWDSLLVTVFVLGWATVLVAAAGGSASQMASALTLGLVMPFLV